MCWSTTVHGISSYVSSWLMRQDWHSCSCKQRGTVQWCMARYFHSCSIPSEVQISMCINHARLRYGHWLVLQLSRLWTSHHRLPIGQPHSAKQIIFHQWLNTEPKCRFHYSSMRLAMPDSHISLHLSMCTSALTTHYNAIEHKWKCLSVLCACPIRCALFIAFPLISKPWDLHNLSKTQVRQGIDSHVLIVVL